MASATLFALLKPNALKTEGFAYCKTTSGEQQGVYAVDRVPSGRWQKAGAVSTRRDVREIEQREVTEEEALSGIGTYVGSAVCIARVPRGKPKVWDYGVVVGYTWSNLTKTGVLQVTFPDETCSIVFDKEEMQDPAIETYALRPCYMRGTADIMPAEMRALHIAAHDHFNGVGQPARRSSATVLKKISMGLVDEDQAVPVFNLECTQVEFLKIEHILNVIFYQVGKRRAPQGITVAKSLFEPVAEATPVGGPRLLNPRATDAERMAQLEDSDDDLAPVETQQDAPLVPERTKRVREEPAAETPADRGEMRLSALRRRLEDDPDMIHEIDQLIAFRQANLSMGSSALVRAAATETKSQFRPSRQQGAVHAAMVNGKYSFLDAQLFVETRLFATPWSRTWFLCLGFWFPWPIGASLRSNRRGG
ncbi:hypothetical protein PR001_g1480 [Phytophthora rubi]|uniref:Uncharacterized protein n=1 Tax=Phytophthora rubi TaxID=129364 RepID=A0A6A3PCW3_9STRA|nr:hypothetical protein PR001_g1480 [Phytophthora rubi]